MLKFKKLHPEAKPPKRSHRWDAGADLTAVSREIKEDYVVYDTGLAFSVPEGWVGLLFPRSSVSNHGLILSNCVGVLDSSYRGSVTFRFRNLNNNQPLYKVGDRIGQLVLIEVGLSDFEEVQELPETERGPNGYGSTGR